MKRQQKAESCGRALAKRVHAQLPEHEWNFDSVPDEELVACCYWEYARESAFIRDAVQTAKTTFASQGIAKPESEERDAFRVAANKAFGLLHLTGFDISFWVGLPFPKPWQSVDKTERKRWAHCCPRIPTPEKIPPFRDTCDLFIASVLHGEATKANNARQAAWLRLSQIDKGVSSLEEAAELRKELSEQERHPTVLVRGEGGLDSFIAQINWRDFTDKQIVTSFKRWVRENRPTIPGTKQLVGRRDDKGRKLNDWRVMLDRLGIMRLVHRFTLREMCPEALSHYRSADWYRERQSADHDFHRLFPFLLSTDRPLAWPTKGGSK
jgi:hypothetical protein